jgi:hypothetical protein
MTPDDLGLTWGGVDLTAKKVEVSMQLSRAQQGTRR